MAHHENRLRTLSPPGASLATATAKVQEFAAIVKKEIPAKLITTSAGRPKGLAGLFEGRDLGSVTIDVPR